MPRNASPRIYDALFSTPQMLDVLSDAAYVEAMLRFEAALGFSLESAGIAPDGTGEAIAKVGVEQLDIHRLAQEARGAGNLCIPFVKELTQRVAQANPSAAGFVHWGATSQDAQDTATVLQAKQAWHLLSTKLNQLCTQLVGLGRKYQDAVLPGRTWLQQGPPVTLGLKIAGWVDALNRHHDRMIEVCSRAFALQFGGAVGSLAALRDKGSAVASALAEQLQLDLPAIPWHANRDRLAELATALGLLAGTLGKIGRDTSLLMQTEVAECEETSGSGGSSTMPHKRNPVNAAIMLSAATRMPALVSTMLSAMVQEHERGLGGWHAEWEVLPEIFRLCSGSLDAAFAMASTLRVNETAMEENLEILHGAAMAESLSFALAEKVGKPSAHSIVEELSREALQQKTSLLDAAIKDERVTANLAVQDLEKILTPAHYLGSSNLWMENVWAQHEVKNANR